MDDRMSRLKSERSRILGYSVKEFYLEEGRGYIYVCTITKTRRPLGTDYVGGLSVLSIIRVGIYHCLTS